jgi:hypothetical protein
LAEGRDLAAGKHLHLREKSQRILSTGLLLLFSYFGIVRANKSEVNDQMSRDNDKTICEEEHN